MEKEEKNQQKNTGARGKPEKKYELSEEAKIGPEDRKHIKDLGNGKEIVSSKPKFGPEEETDAEINTSKRRKKSEERVSEKTEQESLQEKTEKMLENTGEESKQIEKSKDFGKREELTSEKETPVETRKRKRENAKQQKTPKITISSLVSLLASYRVPLDAPVRKLIKEIKKKGESHLRKELNK